jgi:hypothetical protein
MHEHSYRPAGITNYHTHMGSAPAAAGAALRTGQHQPARRQHAGGQHPSQQSATRRHPMVLAKWRQSDEIWHYTVPYDTAVSVMSGQLGSAVRMPEGVWINRCHPPLVTIDHHDWLYVGSLMSIEVMVERPVARPRPAVLPRRCPHHHHLSGAHQRNRRGLHPRG